VAELSFEIVGGPDAGLVIPVVGSVVIGTEHLPVEQGASPLGIAVVAV
jgi:hypothetical protein